MTKIRSLSAHPNPLERLQQLDAEINPANRGAAAEAANPAESRRVPDARTSAPTHARADARSLPCTPAPAHAPGTGVAGPEEQTLAQLLAAPFPADPAQGPFQAATVRMPAEIWKRVGWVSSLTGRTKQDVVGEALVRYLEQLRAGARGRG
jgi:hypothetical protein